MTIIADGSHQYEMVDSWAHFPDGVDPGDVSAVAVDADDRVYLFTRGEHPMIVLDAEGNVLRTWGHGVFKNPHGLQLAADGYVYCTDDGDHTVRKCTPEGEIVLEIGIPGRPSPVMSGRPFNRCTHTALSPQGDIYVSDGYQNACIHRFAPDGRHLSSWGASGTGPGEFYFPHNLVCDADGWVYVADRENHRIQVFDGAGRFEAIWTDLHRPCALCMGGAFDDLFYVAELGPLIPFAVPFPNLGPRLSIFDAKGERQARLDVGPAGIGPGRMIAPHGIAVDSRGDIYVGEVSRTTWPALFRGEPVPDRLPSLHKLRRLGPS